MFVLQVHLFMPSANTIFRHWRVKTEESKVNILQTLESHFNISLHSATTQTNYSPH